MNFRVRKVLEVCEKVKRREVGALELQNILSWAEHSITEYELKELRKFFMLMENEVEYIRVMNNPADFEYSGMQEKECYDNIIPIVEKIENFCLENEKLFDIL